MQIYIVKNRRIESYMDSKYGEFCAFLNYIAKGPIFTPSIVFDHSTEGIGGADGYYSGGNYQQVTIVFTEV